MAWTTLTFAYGSILTSTKMTQLYDNFAALANADSGAPQLSSTSCFAANVINNNAMANDAIKRAEIDTSTGVTSTAIGGSSGAIVSTSDYCFYPGFDQDTGNPLDLQSSSAVTTYGQIYAYNSSGISITAQWRYRYVTASGEPFIMALEDPVTGEFHAVCIADDPCMMPHLFGRKITSHKDLLPEETALDKWPVKFFDDLHNPIKTDLIPRLSFLLGQGEANGKAVIAQIHANAAAAATKQERFDIYMMKGYTYNDNSGLFVPKP